jgi:hypothetical protein
MPERLNLIRYMYTAQRTLCHCRRMWYVACTDLTVFDLRCRWIFFFSISHFRNKNTCSWTIAVCAISPPART